MYLINVLYWFRLSLPAKLKSLLLEEGWASKAQLKEVIEMHLVVSIVSNSLLCLLRMTD